MREELSKLAVASLAFWLAVSSQALGQVTASGPAPTAVQASKTTSSLVVDMSSAVRNGDAAKVKELLAANPRLVFQQATNIPTVRTWQHTAAEKGHTNVMELLIAANADLNVVGDAINSSGMRYTPLHLAAANGHTGIVRQLLAAGARVDPVDTWGATPLYFALTSAWNFATTAQDPRARLGAIELLLRNGANVLAPMREYGRTNTPLELVLTPGRTSISFLDVLLTNAQPPTVRDPQGNTLLHLALARGRRVAAEALLRLKADLNVTNRAGLTPFQNSVFFGPPQPLDPATGLRMEPPGYWNLLAAGVRPDLFTLAGMGDRASLVERFTADKSLAKSARDGGGRTLLHWAATKGYADVVELLLEHGADPAAADAQGRLPLHEAAQSGRVEILPRLATRELAGREDGSRRTAFELSVQHTQPVAAEWLLRFKPDLTRTNVGGESPLHLVITQGNTDLAAQLLVAGPAPPRRIGTTRRRCTWPPSAATPTPSSNSSTPARQSPFVTGPGSRRWTPRWPRARPGPRVCFWRLRPTGLFGRRISGRPSPRRRRPGTWKSWTG